MSIKAWKEPWMISWSFFFTLRLLNYWCLSDSFTMIRSCDPSCESKICHVAPGIVPAESDQWPGMQHGCKCLKHVLHWHSSRASSKPFLPILTIFHRWVSSGRIVFIQQLGLFLFSFFIILTWEVSCLWEQFLLNC